MRLVLVLFVLVVAITGVVLVVVDASGDDDGCEMVTGQGVRQLDCGDVVDLVTGD